MKKIHKYLLFGLVGMWLISCSSIYTPPEVEFIKTEQCKDCEEFLKNRYEISNKVIVENNKEYCFNEYIRKGDNHIGLNGYYLKDYFYGQKNYKKALILYPKNQEVLFKIANNYLIMDSIKQAVKYLDRIEEDFLEIPHRGSFYKMNEIQKGVIFPKIDVKSLKNKLKFNDSIVSVFLDYEDKSCLKFDYLVQHQDFIDHFLSGNVPDDFVKIYGDGRFEANLILDDKTNGKKRIEGVLPKAELQNILNKLLAINFLSFNKLLVPKEKYINRFFNDDDFLICPDNHPRVFERISITTPLFEHSINIYALVDQNSDVECGQAENCIDGYSFSNTCKVLEILSQLWNELFSKELLKYAEEDD